MRRFPTALVVVAVSLIAAAPAAAVPIIDAPDALPEPTTPVLIDRAQEAGTLSLERANLLRVYALTGDDRLPAIYESDTPADGTLLVRRLQAELPLMDPGEERRAVSLALRAASPSPASTCFSSIAALPDTRETTHFVIQYSASALAASSEPLTIEDIEQSLETAWTTQIDQFGWAAPPRTAAADRDLAGKYHVRVDNSLGPAIYGFVSNSGTYAGRVGDNPATTAWNEGDADATCMVLNGDFSQFPGTALGALDATTAHEFNHSLQFGYGALSGFNTPDDHFIEGGATWMEDEVQDASNDNYNYLYPAFEDSMGEHDQGDIYAYWLTFRGLTERFGTNAAGAGEDVMQEFWELTSRNQANMLTAMQGGLARKDISLAAAYHDYAIAAKFVRPCGGGYVLPFCFEEAGGYRAATGGEPAVTGAVSSIGAAYNGSVEDNYALNWVALPLTGSYDVTVRNASAGGSLRVSVACDTGAAVVLAPMPVTLGPGAEGRVPGFDPAGCQQAVAVITNESQTAPDPSSSTARAYTVSTAPPVNGPPAGTDSVTATPVAPAPVPPTATASRLVFVRAIVRRTGTVLIRARVSGAGTLKAIARARVLGKRLTVARRTVRPERAGTVTLRLKAGTKSRRILRRRNGGLRARVTLVFLPEAGARRTRAKTVTFLLKSR